ncbi:MAG: hypothetical protein HC837_16705 [Chloroflexaceae bacterium]|nr:hypothetical protein [Chloroflexaceae bacterium]
MIATDSRQLTRRLMVLLIVPVLLSLMGLAILPDVVQAQPTVPLNVPALAFSVDCRIADVDEIWFGYYQLDGSIEVSSATRENGGMTISADGVPVIVYQQLSFDWERPSAFRFIFRDDSTFDLQMDPEDWLVDEDTGAVFSGVTCSG